MYPLELVTHKIFVVYLFCVKMYVWLQFHGHFLHLKKTRQNLSRTWFKNNFFQGRVVCNCDVVDIFELFCNCFVPSNWWKEMKRFLSSGSSIKFKSLFRGSNVQMLKYSSHSWICIHCILKHLQPGRKLTLHVKWHMLNVAG